MTTTPPDSLRLRTDAVRGAMASQGITSQDQLAEVLGVGRATVVRAFTGKHAPGDALIAGLRLRLNLPYDLIVEAVPADQRTTRTAAGAKQRLASNVA